MQHEYGIFGGKAGAHVLALLRELRMPIVTTLHTILAEPNPMQRSVMDELTSLSERVVVMSEQGAKLLARSARRPRPKDRPHPSRHPERPVRRAQQGPARRRRASGSSCTFGLLSPDKGIENVIDAMPAILARYPDTVYIVLGATHPHVKEQHGETYRLMLESRAQKLGVAANMIFHNRFVSQAELAEFLAAADVYITPYLKPEQITSGTLAYAVGSGKAVISTPYWYATELLADGRGILVPWRDPEAIAREVIGLFDDPAQRVRAPEARGRVRTEDGLARGRAPLRRELRAGALGPQRSRLRSDFQARTLAMRPAELPEINLEHLRIMTDDTGMLQHAAFNVPRYDDGYCLDDNARALLLTTLIEDAGTEPTADVRALASRYLAFVNHAFNADAGRFRNFMSYARQWTEEQGSEDSHGRALWALGTVVGRSADPGRQSLAGELFQAALPAVDELHEPARVGLRAARHRRVPPRLPRRQRASRPPGRRSPIVFSFATARAAATTGPGSRTASPTATRASRRRSSSRALEWGTSEMVTVALRVARVARHGAADARGVLRPRRLQRLLRAGRSRGQPSTNSRSRPARWSRRASTRSASRENAKWGERARRAFGWFLGQNQLQQSLYDPRTGGCRDGLHADRVNENQGAESTLSFLLALLEMRSADRALMARSKVQPNGVEARAS